MIKILAKWLENNTNLKNKIIDNEFIDDFFHKLKKTFQSCNQQDQETQEATMFVSHKKLIEFQLNFN